MARHSFEALGEFPFRRLARSLADLAPPADVPALDLALGEPQHAPPTLLAETVARNAHSWNRYPTPMGTRPFREAVAAWLTRRYGLSGLRLDPDRHILPLAGTKEGLFLLASVAARRAGAERRDLVLMPSPLYTVYRGAAALADAEAVLLPATAETGFLPDLEAIEPATWQRAIAFYLCSPANPQGAVATSDYLARALQLARRHGVLLVSDECYSEIWDELPPAGALQAAEGLGEGLEGLVVLNSLSKRSNAAGLRSGFIAGDPDLLSSFLTMRAYGAAVQPLPLMAAATELWNDEEHVADNQALYRRKIDIAEQCLGGRFGFYRPPGGFFLWLNVDDGEAAVRTLWREAALKALPGAYLAPQPAGRGNPANSYLRIALVHDEAIVSEALERFARTLAPVDGAKAVPSARITVES